MKTIGNYLYLLCCLCLLASRKCVLANKKLKTYSAAKQHYEGKGYFKGPYAFARKGEQVDGNAFHDVMGALFLSEFIYCLGLLREDTKTLGFNMHNRQELEDEVLKTVTNKKSMTELLLGDFVDPSVGPSIKVEDIEEVLKYDQYKLSNKAFTSELMVTAMQAFKNNNVFVHTFDAKHSKKNLVYSIAGRQRSKDEPTSQGSSKKEVDLFLTFRGSTTPRDWIQNFQTPLVNITLRQDIHSKKCFMIEPITFTKFEITKELFEEFKNIIRDTGEGIMIHSGFLKYLFADRGEDEDGTLSDNLMFPNIRTALMGLLKERSDQFSNNLYVTGHSLGGSLATVAAFFLASDKQINEKRGANWEGVKCITFAPPSAGNLSFQRAFEVLAKKSHLQTTKAKPGKAVFTNIRITNSRDPVPMLIPFSRYRHTPGITSHLGRIFWLRRIFKGNTPSRPATRHFKAHLHAWQWDKRYLWMIFSPTSFIAGLFGSWGRFLCFAFATIPIAFAVILLLLRPIYMLLPALLPIRGSKILPNTLECSKYGADKAIAVGNVLVYNQFANLFPKNTNFEDIGKGLTNFATAILSGIPGYFTLGLYLVVLIPRLFLKNPPGFYKFIITLFSAPAFLGFLLRTSGVKSFAKNYADSHFVSWIELAIYCLSFVWTLLIPNPPLIHRLALVFLGLPAGVGFLVQQLGGEQAYDYMAENGAAAFIVAMVIWQLILFIGRSPLDVLGGAKVHTLSSYYEHLRPYHKQLSSSKVLVDKYLKDA